jgi:putative Mg2+ transporter-C (MgtC) family protein
MAESLFSSAVAGTAMPVDLTWLDLVIRLLCTLIAGAIIGYDRGERAKPAGLRTTVLVCMAASIAMLQMNYLLPLAGRPTDSFVMNDPMRLPLGILTGVGFIGGGAILRRGSLIVGVTTAATLWYVTVVGLCFGGGQMLLGWLATAIGLFVLSGLRWFETIMAVEQHASLALTLDPGALSENEIRRRLEAAAITIRDIDLQSRAGVRTLTLSVSKLRRRSHRRGRIKPPERHRRSGVALSRLGDLPGGGFAQAGNRRLLGAAPGSLGIPFLRLDPKFFGTKGIPRRLRLGRDCPRPDT